MRIIGLAGWSGAGKTTLALKLIPELNRRGFTVSTVKHADDAFEVDKPGKDSFEHRAAGATEVLVSSSRRWALMHELRDETEPELRDVLARLSPVDIVIVEGFKRDNHPKIEVYRAGNRKPLLFTKLSNVRAVASDVEIPGAEVPVLALNDVTSIAERVLALAMTI
ncbi:molybdopterin-guanine dinucleotide biosynthesis protein B (plasmid) [Microvirga terrae]|uniref:Molybdopterin-guanine dinucleotide biosynthesis protein B n=1 Tax=Microvirga terrae TaxID=2740529 RepID=A0ABY5S144_9HYPH|nr:molybdopterin-guanine dinucleotide biosynthesis protein B [Microvirga terrae]UVF22182.1 molybdopterin-guanine dinucleotide biosynthesis protein B [Microvirga terrae]